METSLWKLSAGFGPSFLETGWLARRPSVSNCCARRRRRIFARYILIDFSTLSRLRRLWLCCTCCTVRVRSPGSLRAGYTYSRRAVHTHVMCMCMTCACTCMHMCRRHAAGCSMRAIGQVHVVLSVSEKNDRHSVDRAPAHMQPAYTGKMCDRHVHADCRAGARAAREENIGSFHKVWKPAGWRDSFLETDWLPQRARFPTLSSLL